MRLTRRPFSVAASGRAAVRRQRLRHQIPAWTTKSRPHRAAKLGDNPPSSTSQSAPGDISPGFCNSKVLAGRVHHPA
jgi:hypothetical protein